jgi:hypothetical protein
MNSQLTQIESLWLWLFKSAVVFGGDHLLIALWSRVVDLVA